MTSNTAETQSSLTMHVAEFVTSSHGSSLPDDVVELGRKSILDGLGLAIAGSACKSGHLVNDYVRDFGGNHASCSVLGTNLKVPARFRGLRQRHRHPCA